MSGGWQAVARVARRLRDDPVARCGVLVFVPVYLALSYASYAARAAQAAAEGAAPGPWYATPLGWTVVGSLFWVVQGLVVLWVAQRFPLEGLAAPRRIAALAAAVAGCTVALVAVGIGIEVAMTAEVGPYTPLYALRNLPSTLVKVCAFAMIAYGVRHARRHRAQEIAASRLESELARARLAALKAQLHPHFLFNTFNSVSALVGRDPAGAREMLARLESLLRVTLEHAQAQEVPLAEELRAVEIYAGIEKVRFSDRLRMEVSADASLAGACVPHLVLQPLVENAIKHGIAVRRGPGRIVVTAAAVDGRLVLRVADDGCGAWRSVEAASASNGVGLANTRARLAQLYGAEHAFDVRRNEHGGMTITVTIPLRFAAIAEGSSPDLGARALAVVPS